MWAQLAADELFDLVVIGGGATGLGVALDASLRGYRVALFESHDFASGTSSRSTKLLHGGVRYLAQGQLHLVREALAERATVLRIAPHLAQPLPFVMPIYRWWQLPFYGLGLKLYDLLAAWGREGGLGATEFLNREETLQRLPGVRAQGLLGGIQYWDAQFDDARLAVALARSAAGAGALVFNHCAVNGLMYRPNEAGAPGVGGVRVLDDVTGQTREVRARCVVNATGVWVDDVRRMDAVEAAGEPGATRGVSWAPMVSPSQGVHLVVDRRFLPGHHALLVPKTRDGRVLFVVPWMGKLILGTTDTALNDTPREPRPRADEIDFILNEASLALAQTITRADVKSVWVGLRPLVRQTGANSEQHTRQVSREHIIVSSPTGLVTVTGGKWTTYRVMAEDVVGHCQAWGLLPPQRERGSDSAESTRCHLLAGGEAPRQSRSPATPLHDAPGTHLYGGDLKELISLQGRGHELAPGLTEAMVRFAAEKEYALTVEDVLARRSRLLFLDAEMAASIAPRVAQLLQAQTGADPGLTSFLELCRAYGGPWRKPS